MKQRNGWILAAFALMLSILSIGCTQQTPQTPTATPNINSGICQSLYANSFSNFQQLIPNKCVYGVVVPPYGQLTMTTQDAKSQFVNSVNFLNAIKRVNQSQDTLNKMQDNTIANYLMVIDYGKCPASQGSWQPEVYVVVFDPNGLQTDATYRTFLASQTVC